MTNSNGASHETSRRWLTGHIGWGFNGAAQFESGATTFLAEGTSRGERLFLVADDPDPELWPQPMLQRGELLLASTTEMYGPDRIVAPQLQLAAFGRAVEEALQDGYTGIRVAADCTSLIGDDDGLAAWLVWEQLADRLIEEKPITGLCAFDQRRTDADVLRQVIGLHSVSMAE